MTETITWFDWVRIILPGVVTGLIAFGAAALAYQFAKRGRKEDILYKESYKSFEKIASYLYEIIQCADKNMYNFIPSITSKKTLIESIEILDDKLTSLSLGEPNRVNLVFLNHKTRNCYYCTIMILEQLRLRLSIIKMSVIEIDMYENIDQKHLLDIHDTLDKLKEEADVCQKLAFRDIGLPRK